VSIKDCHYLLGFFLREEHMRTTRLTAILCLLAPLLSTATSVNGQEGAPASEIVLVKRCALSYERSTVVGVFATHGTMGSRIEECLVKQGDRVKKGQVLGRLF